MNGTGKILAGIETVKLTVSGVTICWDASDLRGIEAAAAQLEGSVRSLKTALDMRENGGYLQAADLRRAAQALKKDTGALERLVDAAAAFVRSGRAFMPDNESAYTFAGAIRPVASRPTESYAG